MVSGARLVSGGYLPATATRIFRGTTRTGCSISDSCALLLTRGPRLLARWPYSQTTRDIRQLAQGFSASHLTFRRLQESQAREAYIVCSTMQSSHALPRQLFIFWGNCRSRPRKEIQANTRGEVLHGINMGNEISVRNKCGV